MRASIPSRISAMRRMILSRLAHPMKKGGHRGAEACGKAKGDTAGSRSREGEDGTSTCTQYRRARGQAGISRDHGKRVCVSERSKIEPAYPAGSPEDRVRRSGKVDICDRPRCPAQPSDPCELTPLTGSTRSERVASSADTWLIHTKLQLRRVASPKVSMIERTLLGFHSSPRGGLTLPRASSSPAIFSKLRCPNSL